MKTHRRTVRDIATRPDRRKLSDGIKALSVWSNQGLIKGSKGTANDKRPATQERTASSLSAQEYQSPPDRVIRATTWENAIDLARPRLPDAPNQARSLQRRCRSRSSHHEGE